MGKIKILIPENLQIKEVIGNNKTAFLKSKLSSAKLFFICDSLVKSRAYSRRKMQESNSEFAPLSSEILQDILHNYKDHLEFLIACNVLETDNYYIEGEKCKGYKFSNTYSGKPIVQVTIKNYILKKAIRNVSEARNQTRKKTLWGYNYLSKWWESGKLRIDESAAFKWIEKYKANSIENIESKLNSKKREAKINSIVDTVEDFKYLVRTINNNTGRYSFSGEGHRFYNPITNLKRELRNFLTYDGKPLVDIDIKNSQPFFSLALFKSSFWETTPTIKSEKIKLSKLRGELYNKIIKSKEIKDIITLLLSSETQYQKGFDLKKYTESVKNGVYYEYIETTLSPFFPERFTGRDKVKKEVLRIMYVNNKMISTPFYMPCLVFKRIFPTVFRVFTDIKNIQNNYLAHLLQRIESHAVLDVICKKLGKEHPDIPIFTIHDNIITTKENEDKVAEIMESEIEKLVGFKPKLGVSDLFHVEIVSKNKHLFKMDMELPFFNLFVNYLLGSNGINSLGN